MLPERDLDFHARIGVIAQHLDHARHRFGILRRLCDQLHSDDLARFGASIKAGFDQDVLVDALVFRHHEQHAVLDEQAAHNA